MGQTSNTSCLDYTMNLRLAREMWQKSYLKIKILKTVLLLVGWVAHFCDVSTQEAEAGKAEVQRQLGP